jgi:hypothetical protein
MRRSIRNNILSVLLTVVAVALPAKGWSFGYNPWTTMTGEKTLAINPFVYNNTSLVPFTLSADLVAWYGISPKVDVAVNLSTLNILTPFSWGGFWVMPRVELAPNNILGITLGYTGSAFAIKPEYHLIIYPEKGIFKFEGNLRVPITVGAASGATLDIQAVLVPILEFAKNKFAFFVEVNPYVKIVGVPRVDFSLPINPGVWFGFAEAKHQIALALTGIGLSGGVFGAPALGLGVSYYTTVAFK